MSQEVKVDDFIGRWWHHIDRVSFPGMTVGQFVEVSLKEGLVTEWDEEEVRPIWDENLIPEEIK